MPRKACRSKEYYKQYQRDWIAKNRDRVRARQRAWFLKNREKMKAYHRAWRNKRGPEHMRGLYMKYRFGLTMDQYKSLLAIQGGGCAICGGPETGNGRWHGNAGKLRHFTVDHDHLTDSVRGLLCRRCNRALGLFKDDPNHLLSAFRYLAEKMPRPE